MCKIQHDCLSSLNCTYLELLTCLPFLCAVWKFHKNPIKPRFICAASSSSLTDVSKWLCSFFKAMFPTVNDLWVSKLKKADVPCDSSWILIDSTGVVEVINNLNRSI